MPKYLNNASQPIYYGNTVFAPNQEVETLDTLENKAFTVGSVLGTYAIVFGANDTLYIRFNEETAWTVVTLTPGLAQAASDIVTDINTAYGSVVASVEGGRVRIDAPILSNTLQAVYVAALSVQSTAACVTLGLSEDSSNPVACVSLQAFSISQNSETYNITSANNTFIFKTNNNPNWITATLTIGAVQTAAEIAADINLAYETATADANKIAFAIVPVTIDATIYVKLIAPVYNNFQSKLYIKSTKNTALTVLGFTGDDFDPVVESSYPSLKKTSELPLYNPMIGETIVTFAAAGTQHYYLIDPDACKEIQFVRVAGGGGIKFTVYLESVSNLPPYTLVVLETISINLATTRISKVVITSNGVGSLTVRELKS